MTHSVHAGDDFVDQLFTVAPDTAVAEWVSLLLPAVSWSVELDWPEEVVGLLEGGSNSPDLVDQTLDVVDSLAAESTGDDAVVSEWDSGSVDLSVSPLVDQAADIITGWVSVGDIWLDSSDHVDGGAVEADKDTVVDLAETEELHDLLALWRELVDTRKKTLQVSIKYYCWGAEHAQIKLLLLTLWF